jgi:hypothetical protein
MKMHKSLVDRVVRVYDMWGGRSDDARLRQALTDLDVVTYAPGTGEKILVLAEDLAREKQILTQQNRSYIK